MITNKELPLSSIQPPALQPRLANDDPGIEELAQSIATHGLFNPLTVTPDGDGYRLLAGNRRLAALMRIGATTAPCRIIRAEGATADEVTIAENLIRRDLSPVEEAYAFALYLDRSGTSHETLAARLGKERTYVTRRLMLLDLDDTTLGALEEGIINLSQALILRQLHDPAIRERFIEHAATYGANVRTMQYWVTNYVKENARLQAAEGRDLQAADVEPPRQVLMACDRCADPTPYESLRPTYLCNRCRQALAAYRAAKEGET